MVSLSKTIANLYNATKKPLLKNFNSSKGNSGQTFSKFNRINIMKSIFPIGTT